MKKLSAEGTTKISTIFQGNFVKYVSESILTQHNGDRIFTLGIKDLKAFDSK